MVQKQTRCDWAALPVISAVARAGTLRGAARAIGVSHSTVLRQLAAAEAALGSELFVRRPNGRHEPTPAGQDALTTAEHVEELVTGLERRIQGRDLDLAGPLHVTMPAMLLPVLWPDLAAFADRYPKIDLSVAAGFAYADLAQREADVAIRFVDQPSPELVGRRLAMGAVGVYGSCAYLATKAPRTPLAKHDFIGWAQPSTALARWIRDSVPTARVRARITGDWQLEGAVTAGIGVTLVACALGDSHLDWRRLRLVRDLQAPLWLLSHRDLRASARTRAFRDYLADAVTAKRDLFEGRRPVSA